MRPIFSIDDRIIEEIIDVSTSDFLQFAMLPVVIAFISLIIDWFFFRKNKKNFKKVFYINLIIMSIMVFCGMIFTMIKFENIFEGRVGDKIILWPYFLIFSVFNLLKLYFFKKNNITPGKAYKIIYWIFEAIFILIMLSPFGWMYYHNKYLIGGSIDLEDIFKVIM